LNTLNLGEETYSWIGKADFLREDYFKITKADDLYVKEITSNFNVDGIILIGNLSVTVDSVIYSSSNGACGDTYQFNGKSLVILGITMKELEASSKISLLKDPRKQIIDDRANEFIDNLREKILRDNCSISFDKDEEMKYIIFGKHDFFLIGNTSQFVLIHKKHISIRKGEEKLVEISPEIGIRISDKKKSFSINRPQDDSSYSILGDIGVNIASTILENLIWD
jgi:hypothetical protein